MVLAPQDARKVMDAGWGQLHPMAGREILKKMIGKTVPRAFILIYAPRDDGEIERVMEVVRAAVGYMTDSTELIV